ncbi:hypothetical protein PFICI_08842 [Pestalotiopsis fici W106-1]|uniref:Rhodopsin domain-containing protein n=1 Tax=Pestalotiopsis fici (strain W106-1 / CGMCC3.15140) TaxID=1229662 RepID=W3WYX9_PESFW|nr:uncharacterized protein PFICI_08842 [Pestalotiopsis fici W106-1]ETS78989.1 hypothetical protein PFICI_08842 [Pestalotiopsis fici W106-1]
MFASLQSFYVSNASYAMSTALVKASLLFQYLRIFKSGCHRIICIVILVITCLWGAAYTILTWFPCKPIHIYWNWTSGGGHCWAFASLHATQFYGAYFSHAVTNMVLDFCVLAIPMPLYFRSTTTGPTRRRLLMLFGAGTLVSGVSIWRLAACIEHKAATDPVFDPTWYGVPVIVLGMMEVNAASICACVPVFWPALTARMDQIFVTQEIKITRERRFSEEGDDEIELQDSNSRTLSMSSQHNLTKKEMHYMDDYVIEQVDPLRDKTRNVEVSTELPSKTVGRKQSTRKWRVSSGESARDRAQRATSWRLLQELSDMATNTTIGQLVILN